jgi:acetyltransferase-like isoleucine patch superfamily enzyme
MLNKILQFKYFKIASDYISLFVYKIISIFRIFFPNIFVLLNKNVKFSDLPTVYSKIKFDGNGKIFIGNNCVFGYKIGGRFKYSKIEIQPRYKHSKIKIGNHVAFNNNVFLCSANIINIGSFTRIGEGVTIFDFDAHSINPLNRNNVGTVGFVEIGNNVWIGNNSIILKNVKIGNNSIVAAGSVVTKSFGENVIIGGNPAKLIKSI